MRKILTIIVFCAIICSALCANCPGAQIYDSTKKTCLLTKTDCVNGYISSDQLNCISSCAQGESVFEYKVKDVLQFKQCYKCEDKQYFNIDKYNLMYTCSSGCKLDTDEKDDTKYVCSPCSKLIVYDGDYYCKDSCTNANHYLQYNEGDDEYYCQYFCDSGFIKEAKTKMCISPRQCSEYVYQNSCVSTCPVGNFIYEKENNQKFQICSSSCSNLAYSPDKDTKQCIKNCPEEHLIQDGEICISLEECEDKYISYDGKNCLNSCPQFMYAKTNSDGKQQCDVCNNFAQIEEDENGPKIICVDSCSSGYIQYQHSLKACIPINQCPLFNSDKSRCVQDCIYPDIQINRQCVNPCQGKSSDCVPECDAGQYKYFTQTGFRCIDYCEEEISSDQKICVDSCSQIGEMHRSENSQTCIACNSNQLGIIDSSYQIICVSKTSLSLDDQMKAIEQQKEFGFSNFFMYNRYNSVLHEIYSEIITLNNTQSIISQLKTFVELAEIQHIIKRQTQQTTTISDSKNTYILKLEAPTLGKKLKNIIDFAQFKSDSSYSLQESGFNNDGESNIVYSTLTTKNPFCHNEACKFSNIVFSNINTPYIRSLEELSTSQPYKVIFPVDKSIPNFEKLICVSYDNYGQMFTHLEWTKFDDAKTSVTCAYTSNTALYVDTTCLFIDKSNCKLKEVINNVEDQEDNDEEDDDGLSGGQIAGIVIGSIAGALLIGFVIVKLVLSKKSAGTLSKYKDQPQVTNTEQNKFV